jgi:hypothetical protein
MKILTTLNFLLYIFINNKYIIHIFISIYGYMEDGYSAVPKKVKKASAPLPLDLSYGISLT